MCETLKDTRYDDPRNQWNKIVSKEKLGGTWPYRSDWGEQFKITTLFVNLTIVSKLTCEFHRHL